MRVSNKQNQMLSLIPHIVLLYSNKPNTNNWRRPYKNLVNNKSFSTIFCVRNTYLEAKYCSKPIKDVQISGSLPLLLKWARPVQATSVPERRNSSLNLIAKESISNSVLCQVKETQGFNISHSKTPLQTA